MQNTIQVHAMIVDQKVNVKPSALLTTVTT